MDKFYRVVHAMEKSIVNVSVGKAKDRYGWIKDSCCVRIGVSSACFFLTDRQVRKLIKALQDYLAYKEKQ